MKLVTITIEICGDGYNIIARYEDGSTYEIVTQQVSPYRKEGVQVVIGQMIANPDEVFSVHEI